MKVSFSRIIFSIFLLFFISGINNRISAQIFNKAAEVNTDSLKQQLSLAAESGKVELFFGIAEGYEVFQPDSCLKYASLGYELVKTKGSPGLLAEANNLLGKAYFYLGRYDESLACLLKGSDYYLSIKDTLKAYENVAILSLIYVYTRNHGSLGLTIREVEENYIPAIRDTMELAFIVSGIGWCYYMMGQYDLSNSYYDRFFEIGHSYPLPPILKAHFHKHKGINYELMGDYHRALECYLAANAIRKEIRPDTYENFLASAYYHLDSLDKAVHYYQDFLDNESNKDYIHSIADANRMIGKIWFRNMMFSRAEKAYRKALELAEWMHENKMLAANWEADIRRNYMAYQSVGKYREDQALELISRLHYDLYELYDAQSLTNKALDEFIRFHQMREELNNFEQLTAVEEIKSKYEADKKEQTINLLSQEKALSDLQLRQTRVMMFALGGLFLLAIIVAILFIRMLRIRSEQKAVLLEQKLLRSQMNPHFIFNALSNITNLVEKQDNTAASRYLNRFARLVRHILESTREDFIMLDEELKNLENYLELQKLRLSNKFSYSITIEDTIDPEEVMVLPMLIQPFVENAIEHGIRPKEGPGQIAIRFHRHGDLITCEVEDDGIGRERSLKIEAVRAGHRSYGVTIARERLAAMSKKLRRQVKLSILDLKNDAGEAIGTRVVIDMPFKLAV